MQKKAIYRKMTALALGLLTVLPVLADGTGDGIRITDPTMVRNGAVMTVGMGIEFPGLKVKRTHATVLTPMIVNGTDTLRLPSLEIHGRTSWYVARRNDRLPMVAGSESAVRCSEDLAPVAYSQHMDYADWMNGSELIVERAEYGCAGCAEGKVVSELARYKKVIYRPVFIYGRTVAEAAKTRELSGRAYVDFPVNRTEIRPDYRRNAVELKKILGTIDSVKNDKDITVTAIAIKGFASPEGTYANNERLAKGRTEALRNYVQTLYRFSDGFIQTSYEPEDWAGLREYVAGSSLPHRDEILALIDDPFLDPDIKDKRIQARYGEDYIFLLNNVYPGLRHSDYKIEYTIRTFSDPVEIRNLLRTQPQKLSLNEIYLAVQDLEPGSDEYNDIFETAVRLFPSEPVASLNAANAAMQRGDLTGAERFLVRAGGSPEATYARGVLAALKGEFKTAIRLVEQAMDQGLTDEQGILDHLREVAE